MSKRLRVTYDLVSFNGGVCEVKATAADGRNATAKGPSYQVAQRAARALVEAQPAREKAPETVRSVAPAQLQGTVDVTAVVNAVLIALGHTPAHVPTAPVQQATPTPTQSNTVENTGLIAPPDKRWFGNAARFMKLVQEMQKASKNTSTPISNADYKGEVDRLMATAGCEPVYGERTKEERAKLNHALLPFHKAHREALKALNTQAA